MVRKLWSIVRWVGVMLLNLIFVLLAKVVYPMLYPLREWKLMNYKPFWWFFDDEDGNYGTQWFRDTLKYGNKTDWFSLFRIAYKWCADRNAAWNAQASLKPKDGEQIIIYSGGSATKNGREVTNLMLFAGFKYVDEDGLYKNNKGDFLSLKHSVIGTLWAWYMVEGKLYWRWSYAGEVFKGFWVETHLGINNHRYTIRHKWKFNLKAYENLSEENKFYIEARRYFKLDSKIKRVSF